ncbi:MAG: hypothetical protein IPJ09_17570 [Saprospiraceae bacterium]|nr:hypothetical protein [Saprospiraceae bacterium]
MKKISVLIIVLYFSYGLMAQTSGVINFTETIKLHMEMPGQDPEMMKKYHRHILYKRFYTSRVENRCIKIIWATRI